VWRPYFLLLVACLVLTASTLPSLYESTASASPAVHGTHELKKFEITLWGTVRNSDGTAPAAHHTVGDVDEPPTVRHDGRHIGNNHGSAGLREQHICVTEKCSWINGKV
jgi:hypothetical protein